MTSDPPESAPPAGIETHTLPTASETRDPPADSTAPEDRAKPKIKIGSQRAGAPPPRVPPRVKTVFSTPDPVGVPGGSESQGRRTPSGGGEPAKAEPAAPTAAAVAPIGASEGSVLLDAGPPI